MKPETSASSHQTPATYYLDRLEIPYRLFRHAGPIESLEQAAQERNQAPEQVVRSLLFRTERGDQREFVLVVMPGPDQVSWPKIRGYLGVRRLTTADAEEVAQVTGYIPGTVSPFGLREPVRLLVDQRIHALSEISVGSGERGLAILMTPVDLLRALPDAEQGDFSPDTT